VRGGISWDHTKVFRPSVEPSPRKKVSEIRAIPEISRGIRARQKAIPGRKKDLRGGGPPQRLQGGTGRRWGIIRGGKNEYSNSEKKRKREVPWDPMRPNLERDHNSDFQVKSTEEKKP